MKVPAWLKQLWRRRLVRVLLLVIFGLVIFYAGYSLAAYQSDFNLPMLPTPTHYSPPTCTGLPECGYHCPTSSPCIMPDEPVIYLYPTHPSTVNVQLSYRPGFRLTEPYYYPSKGWTVRAQPSGQLVDVHTGQTYPYLIWEGNQTVLPVGTKDGFVVARAQLEPFLQSKLSVLGLSTQEISDFIGYWVPKMQSSPYLFVHFAGSEYTSQAPLNVSPQPDSILRVFMTYRELAYPIAVSPQQLPRFQRHGFSLIEWGGSQLH